MALLFAKDDCHKESNMNCCCIEFHPDEHCQHCRRGFHAGQLIAYYLGPNPDAKEGNADAPPQKLALAFSTADVVILGWRLDRIADYLGENRLVAVRARPKRYVELAVRYLHRNQAGRQRMAHSPRRKTQSDTGNDS
jgi:hypothetical protein